MSIVCPTTLPTHQDWSCETNSSFGGINAIGIFFLAGNNSGLGTDFGNPTKWGTAISANNAMIIKTIKGEYPPPSPQMGENLIGCGPEQTLYGKMHEIKWEDQYVGATNDSVYQQLEDLPNKCGIAVFSCDNNTIRVLVGQVVFVNQLTIPKEKKDKQKYALSAKIYLTVKEGDPLSYPAPSGIFS